MIFSTGDFLDRAEEIKELRWIEELFRFVIKIVTKCNYS